MNVQRNAGRALACASNAANEGHVPMHALVLHDAVLVPELGADVAANLAFFGLVERQILEALLNLRALTDGLADPAQLREGGNSHRTLTSAMPTTRVVLMS